MQSILHFGGHKVTKDNKYTTMGCMFHSIDHWHKQLNSLFTVNAPLRWQHQLMHRYTCVCHTALVRVIY